MTSYRVRVVDSAAWTEWRGDAFREALAARCAETGETLLRWLGDNPAGFSWICPGCGSSYIGNLGDQPVSGWDAPRWVNSGTLERPTLAPSLGCPRWRDGECVGHWWLRDGELIPA